ncbi:MAG: type II toxin-antitoxin system prevent-host-death family antitoxin [Thiotrichaceae bacterium]
MQITSKELRIQAKNALDAVRRGEEVEITYHGKVVALLVAPDSAVDKPSQDETLPGFGMWADRKDMEDSVEYVRNLRIPRYRL